MSDVVSKVWRCLRGLAARLALAATSLLLFCVAAELIFRAFVAPPELFELREGVYVHSLPLLNGREVLVPSWPERPPMQEEKAPNELRVFVFGESSVYGAPFHPVATAPAMLKDLLQERYPDRKVSVANMGRGSAYTLDSYYYMVAFERFEPDVMVFYQGTNDRFDYDAELCAPVHYPRAYAFYRWLVERSRLLWAVRAYGPQYLRAGRSGEAGSSYPDGMPREPKCGHAEGFVGWARILMETAQEMGATAVAATVVRSDLTDLLHEELNSNPNRDQEAFVAALSEQYREVLACLVTDACDLAGLLRRRVGKKLATDMRLPLRMLGGSSLPEVMRPSLSKINVAWKHVAKERGAILVDFSAALLRRGGSGFFVPPLIVDEVHLCLDGYWYLAHMLSEAVAAALDGRDAPADSSEELPPPRGDVYRKLLDERKDLSLGYCAELRAHAELYLESRRLLFGARLMKAVAEECDDAEARSYLAWLRTRIAAKGGSPPVEGPGAGPAEGESP